MTFENIRFLSYSRLMKNEADIENLQPDYIILDEFHRCGAMEWGKGVKKLLNAYPNAKKDLVYPRRDNSNSVLTVIW